MEEVQEERELELTIEDIHSNDGYAWVRKELIGKKFLATLTFTNVQYKGWYTIVGRFLEKTGIPEIDSATENKPLVITISKYSL